jgi:hypothetical protein
MFWDFVVAQPLLVSLKIQLQTPGSSAAFFVGHWEFLGILVFEIFARSTGGNAFSQFSVLGA